MLNILAGLKLCGLRPGRDTFRGCKSEMTAEEEKQRFDAQLSQAARAFERNRNVRIIREVEARSLHPEQAEQFRDINALVRHICDSIVSGIEALPL